MEVRYNEEFKKGWKNPKRSNMPVTAQLKYLRIAPRKVRQVADMIRGKRVDQALTLLDFSTKRAVKPLKKLLASAIANARHNFGFKTSNLFISKILVNEGPTLKRVRARAFGRFFPIHKRTSHIELVLDEIKKMPKEEKGEKAKVKKPSRDKKREREEQKKKLKQLRTPHRIKKQRPRVKEEPKRIFRRKAF